MNSMQKILMMNIHEGRSRRYIARETGVNRETVGKYIKQYEERRRQFLEEGNTNFDVQALIDALTTAPKYTVGLRSKRKLTVEMEHKIRTHLDENEEKRKRGQRKQQKKPIDIWEALVAEDADISYSTVLRFIRRIEKKPKEAFIKAEYDPGDVCEFDWGEAKLTIGGKRQTFQMAAFTSAYGNYRFAYLFTKQKTECFQEAHALFFDHIGSTYKTMVYDNMKVAVKQFVGMEKEPTEGLLQLSLYYGFQYRFCNIHSGNEKGHVERTVEVIRRKAFAFRDEFETLEEANAYLLEICKKRNTKPQVDHGGQTAEERLEQERPYLLPALPPFDAARILHPRTNKYATVVIDQNHYSVPDHLVGEIVMAKVYATRILLFYEGVKIADHERLTGCHEWRLELEHFLSTIKRKPGALAGSTALQQASQKIKNIHSTYYTKREKEFIELLQFIQEGSTLVEVDRAISELRCLHPSHVTTDKIKVLCTKYKETPEPTIPISQTGQEIFDRSKQHLRLYDELFKTQTLIKPEEALA